MTRFELNYNGAFGAYWKADAEKEVARMQAMANNGEIGVDANGAAYWINNGRFIPEDCAQMLSHTDFRFSIQATTEAREMQTAAFIESYIKHHHTTDEERLEARSELGPNAINIITGERI